MVVIHCLYQNIPPYGAPCLSNLFFNIDYFMAIVWTAARSTARSDLQVGGEWDSSLQILTCGRLDWRPPPGKTERRFWAKFSAHISVICAEKLKHGTPSAFFQTTCLGIPLIFCLFSAHFVLVLSWRADGYGKCIINMQSPLFLSVATSKTTLQKRFCTLQCIQPSMYLTWCPSFQTCTALHCMIKPARRARETSV